MGAQTNNSFTPKSESLRLVADVDAALEQHVFEISQRQREPHVHHHHQADDLGRRVEIAKRAGWLSRAWHWRLLGFGREEL